MGGSPEVEQPRRGRMVLVYAGLFAALALVGLGCWKWCFIQERWYAHKYEKTQDPAWRLKLEKLGEKHPELLLSRWFCLAKSEETASQVADLPRRVRQEALRLWLRERLKGNWWADKCVPVSLNTYRTYPATSGPEDWALSADVLREAMGRVTKPPSSTGLAIFEFYEVCVGLANCGNDAGLPHLEDQMYNFTGCYGPDPDAITDCYQGPKGVVALAAHGNGRARSAVTKALEQRRRRNDVAREVARAISHEKAYRPEDVQWLRAALADHEKRCAAERASAEARYTKLAADIARDSSVASAQVNFCMTHALHSYRVGCRDGAAFVEEMSLAPSGQSSQWTIRRRPLDSADYAVFWKELLEFDLWELPEDGAEHPRHEHARPVRAAFRVGARLRTVQRSSVALFWAPDEPASWVRGFVKEHLETKDGNGIGVLKSGTASSSGQFLRPERSGPASPIADRWLRGEPWEEIAKAAAASSSSPEPGDSGQPADPVTLSEAPQ